MYHGCRSAAILRKDELGTPPKAQRSGFRWERTSCGVNEPCPAGRGERYGESEDDMERNIDKIKRLEHELGRYQKKVADQAKENEAMRSRLLQAYAGNSEAQKAMDAILAQTALTYGEAVTEDGTGKELGHRLRLPMFRVADIITGYEIHARRDEETMEYIIGVVPRETVEEAAAE